MRVLEGLPNWKAENLYSKQKPKQTTTYQYQGSAQEELHQQNQEYSLKQKY